MKKKLIRSAVPIYGAAAVWLILGLIFPMYKLSVLLIAAALSAGTYFLLSKLCPGREVEIETKPNSGDEAVNRQIEEGRATLNQIHASNEAIPDETMTRHIRRMENAGREIFRVLEKQPSKAPQVRRFMNYYLPTTDKLLNSYRQMQAIQTQGENITAAMDRIYRSMDLIATAFEKQLDALYKDSALDIETDIDVMETLLATEGNTGTASEGGRTNG